jgi:hypothetical protein
LHISVHNARTNFATQFHHKTGRGNVPVARNSNPKPQKRQNQTIRKNNTIPQLNFHSSWGLAPDVLAGIMAKLEASNRAEAVAIALRKHLL